MKYYKVIYKTGVNNERIYPSCVKSVVWNIAQYHFTDNVMIGKTERKVKADGLVVVELSDDEALAQIEEFKKSYHEIPEEDRLFLPERKVEAKPVRIRVPKKKPKK